MKKKVVLGFVPPSSLQEKTVTVSMWSTFAWCRKKFEYQYLKRLSKKTAAVYFFVGGIWHNVLSYVYGHLNDSPESLVLHTKKMIDAAVDKELTKPLVDTYILELEKARATLIGMSSGYITKYLAQDKKIWKVLTIERSFKIPLNNGWKVAGKIDLQVSDRGLPALVEHKSTGQLDAGYVARLPVDMQIQEYTWAMFHDKQFVKPQKVIYNVTQKSNYRQRKSETIDTFCDRVSEDYVINPTKYFYRESLSVIPKLDLFEEELYNITKEIDRCIEQQNFYRNTSVCTLRGQCQFLPICLDGGINKENSVLYRVRERLHEELEDESE